MANTMKILNDLLEKYTQEGLARDSKISLRSIQNYLNGKEPGKENARKLRELYEGKAEKPLQVPDGLGVILEKVIQIEAMQKVQVTVLQELFAKAQGIPNMEAGAIIDKALGQELQKIREKLKL